MDSKSHSFAPLPSAGLSQPPASQLPGQLIGPSDPAAITQQINNREPLPAVPLPISGQAELISPGSQPPSPLVTPATAQAAMAVSKDGSASFTAVPLAVIAPQVAPAPAIVADEEQPAVTSSPAPVQPVKAAFSVRRILSFIRDKRLFIIPSLTIVLIGVAGAVYFGVIQPRRSNAPDQGSAPSASTQPNVSPSSAAPTQYVMSANDQERQDDINAMQSLLEAYFAQQKQYPTLANVNDSTWLAQHNGPDHEVLRDPQGTSYTLVDAPTPDTYSYQVRSDDGSPCDNFNKICTQYTLTAILDNGSQYSKTNF